MNDGLEPRDAKARARDMLRAFGGRGHDVALPASPFAPLASTAGSSPAEDPKTGTSKTGTSDTDGLAAWRAPVVFASPHSGAVYPARLLRASPLTTRELRRNEDAFVDMLFACAPELGAPLLSARFPRCFVDVNRAGDDLPPEWKSDEQNLQAHPPGVGVDSSAYRSRMGLGVVPIAISESLGIYSHPPSRADVQARLDALYHPYHGALRLMLERARAAFGRALLIDCHSMPGQSVSRTASGGSRLGRGPGVRRADVVLGDAHGRACERRDIDRVQRAWERRGYRVVRNHPYAGGFSTLHYGRPLEGIGAVQIEINRELYLNPHSMTPKRGFEALREDIRGVVADVVGEMEAESLPMAAE